MNTTIKSFFTKFGTGILAVAVVLASFGGGIYIGMSRTSAEVIPAVGISNIGKPGDVNFSLFWKAWDILNSKFVQTHNKGTTTDQDRVYGAIQGLAASYGDPYTVFFPPAQEKDFQTQITGNFEGVGMEIGIKDNVLIVVAPLKGSPAAKAGIKPGDMVLKINATSTANMSVDQAVQTIHGKKGTTVVLTILTPGDKDTHDVSIVRDVINIPTIDTELRPDGVYVIHLYTFTENSAVLFRDAVQKFVQSGSNKLVLDLRGNPGGYLDAAVSMASWFLPGDQVVVTEDTGGHGTNNVYKSAGYNIFNKNLKMAVLIDGGSASASEILAGALQQHGIAKLVGATSFGKGSVQELVPLTSDTSLKITVARWLTPNGTSISDHGLTPDVEVKMTVDDFNNKKDPQMDAAAALLLK